MEMQKDRNSSSREQHLLHTSLSRDAEVSD